MAHSKPKKSLTHPLTYPLTHPNLTIKKSCGSSHLYSSRRSSQAVGERSSGVLPSGTHCGDAPDCHLVARHACSSCRGEARGAAQARHPVAHRACRLRCRVAQGTALGRRPMRAVRAGQVGCRVGWPSWSTAKGVLTRSGWPWAALGCGSQGAARRRRPCPPRRTPWPGAWVRALAAIRH